MYNCQVLEFSAGLQGWLAAQAGGARLLLMSHCRNVCCASSRQIVLFENFLAYLGLPMKYCYSTRANMCQLVCK